MRLPRLVSAIRERYPKVEFHLLGDMTYTRSILFFTQPAVDANFAE